MNNLLRVAAVLVANGFLASDAIADEAIVPDAAILNQYPTLNGEELKQMPFKASLPENSNPGGVWWELHNPTRDKTIAGIVITVGYKLPSADQPTVLELFIRTTCGPLQSTSGFQGCFQADEIAKLSPTVKLKEVHYAPDGVERVPR